MKTGILFFLMLSFSLLNAQEREQEVLSFAEYLAYVKRYHPVARQADIHLERGEAELLRARGGFDPKIEVDYARKEFKGTEYYDLLNSTFKIPTWYGLELKAGFEQNDGVFLNPQRTVPPEGLFSAGVSVAVGEGMFINERMASLRAARAFREQTVAERDLMVNQVLFEAAAAYFDWLEVYNELEIYEDFVENALIRFRGVKRNAEIGEVAAIDTVEAKISLQDRTLQLEQARVELMKQRLRVSNFLWLQNNVPVELQPHMIPDRDLAGEVNTALDITAAGGSLEGHPKLRALRAKLRALEIDRRLKSNKLLPEVNLEYNFITPDADDFATYHTTNYKAGLRVNFPLFLRKERGELRLAEFKLQDAGLELELSEREIENKIEALTRELESYQTQILMIDEIVDNYNRMLSAEERRFSFGESSLFLINNRENKLIEARLKQIELFTKYLYARAGLFQSLGTNPDDL